MTERETNIAKQFGIFDKMQKLENELLSINGVPEVEFDMRDFVDDINYVIVIPKYSVPASAVDYYERRKNQLQEILDVCKKNDLHPSGDRIEDYGEHWYIVRECGKTWESTEC